MILAAGRGQRMRPLTEHRPKPLLAVGGVPLIEYALRGLAAAGVVDVVVNLAHLGDQIERFCGDGSRWGLRLSYSREGRPLETAGGILHARRLLGPEPFLVVNGDVWCPFPLARLRDAPLRPNEAARLVMVPNPPQHPDGDFILDERGWLRPRPRGTRGVTYAGIGLYSWALFEGAPSGVLALRPLLDRSMAAGALGGELFAGPWEDVGTPERLAALDARLCEAARAGTAKPCATGTKPLE